MVEVATTNVFTKLGNGLFLEIQSDVERFVVALKAELEAAIQQEKRIR